MPLQTRRRYLTAVAGTLTLGIAGCSGVRDALGRTGQDAWPAQGRDAANTGYTPHAGPTESVAVEWQADLGTQPDSGPVVGDGSVYVGSEAGLVALTVDGDRRWRFETGVPRVTTPTLDGDTVFVGSDGLYAVGTDGERRWRFETLPDRFSKRWIVTSAPAVVDGTVYTADYGVYAVDADDGTEIWHFETDGLPATPDEASVNTRGSVWGGPAVADGTVYAASIDGVLYAIDADTGAVRWRFDTGRERQIRAQPTVVGDTAYVADAETVYAVAAEDGTARWRWRDGDLPIQRGGVAVADGMVYLSRTELVALDADTGEERWRRDEARYGRNGAPAVAGDAVYAGGANDDIHAVDAEDGRPLWSRAFSGRELLNVVGGPAVAGGSVYVSSPTAGLCALGGRETTQR